MLNPDDKEFWQVWYTASPARRYEMMMDPHRSMAYLVIAGILLAPVSLLVTWALSFWRLDSESLAADRPVHVRLDLYVDRDMDPRPFVGRIRSYVAADPRTLPDPPDTDQPTVVEAVPALPELPGMTPFLHVSFPVRSKDERAAMDDLFREVEAAVARERARLGPFPGPGPARRPWEYRPREY